MFLLFLYLGTFLVYMKKETNTLDFFFFLYDKLKK
jgi:hypothetical protein